MRLGTALLVSAAVGLAAACGARLSPAELEAADRVAPAPASPEARGTTGPPPVAMGPSAPAPSSPGPSTPGTASHRPGPAPTLPRTARPPSGQAPGGNGGATDVGVSATEITVGNVSTVGGPVPGLFAGAPRGVQAFAAYVNGRGGIHGRSLKVLVADDGLDSNQNRALTSDLEKKVLAFVGSTSTRDNGGAAVLGQTGVPDVGLALNRERVRLATNFSPNPNRSDGGAIGPPNYFKQRFPAVPGRAALFYVNDPASRDSARLFQKVYEAAGYTFVYVYEGQPTEPSYTAQVLQMQSRGVKLILTTLDATNASRLAKAMQQQGFRVDVANFGPQVYSQAFLQLAGSAAEGTLVNLPHAMFEDAGAVPEMQLFLTWMGRTAPGSSPDLFALYGWASARLLAQALEAGDPRITRAGVLARLAQVTTFDANGLLAPANPAAKLPPTCFVVAGVRGGRWVRDDPAAGFICDRGGFQKVS